MDTIIRKDRYEIKRARGEKTMMIWFCGRRYADFRAGSEKRARTAGRGKVPGDSEGVGLWANSPLGILLLFFFSSSCIFIAQTFTMGGQIKIDKPSAS